MRPAVGTEPNVLAVDLGGVGMGRRLRFNSRRERYWLVRILELPLPPCLAPGKSYPPSLGVSRMGRQST